MFQICDYRNLRYQGELQDNLPHGIGIIFDYNHLFCLAQWKNGMMNGALFAISPDSRILCGKMINNQLHGICSIYLPDRIQIFGNYSKEKTRKSNFIAVLPFIKVILEIQNDHNKPKVVRHSKYHSQGQSLQKQLSKIFQTNVDLKEFSTWRQFLDLNFITNNPKKMYWTEKKGMEKQYFFLGLQPEGLGVKIHINDQKVAFQCDGDFFLVQQMGSFNNFHQLTGFGKKIAEYSHNKMEEQSYYEQGQKVGEVLQYPRYKRHKRGLKLFAKKLKSSIFFQNCFFDVNFVSRIFASYSKINVNLVQQTQKIAQVVIENNQDSIILAEIENKKDRKITPKKRSPIIDSEYKRVQMDQSINSDILFVNPEAKKSIYSSIEKLKRNSPTRKYPFQNQQQITKYEQEKQNKQPKRDYKDYLPKEEKSFNESYKKYRYPQLLRNPYSTKTLLNQSLQKKYTNYELKYGQSKSPTYRQKAFLSPETIKKSYQRPNYKYANRQRPQSQLYQKQQSPPLFKRHFQRQSPIDKLKQRDSQKKQLIKYFNNKIQEQNAPDYPQLNRAFKQEPLEQLNRRNKEIPQFGMKKKIPGKIVTYKK